MGVAGRKPKEGPKRNRMPAVHDWTEVEDKPFKGKPPIGLPSVRPLVVKGQLHELALADLTGQWWATVSSMPHCVLWTRSDWMFAVVTALVADGAFRGEPGAMAELRQREKLLGTTVDARRDLRIRYVTPEKAPAAKKPAPAGRRKTATVTSIESRRSRLTGAS